jgi:two-component system sensor histidine kinase ChvG
MAALIVAMFAGIWMNLLRFRRLALSSSIQSGFAGMTDVPELAPIAAAFDGMVQRLHQSADMLRQAAEDNAHAFKGPISTIRIAIEQPQGRNAPPEVVSPDVLRPNLVSADVLPAGAMRAISLALDRLDGLVRSARFLDTAAAELLEPQYDRVDLSELVHAFVESCVAMTADERVIFAARVEDGLAVLAEPAILETILETLVDNAISFSSPGGTIAVALTAQDDTAVITIDDDGPGIAPDRIDRVFERYYTHRTGAAAGMHASAQHFGVGLWLARQNTLSLGGRIEVANRVPHGLRVSVILPLADDG